jgi:hypothetical protein
MQLKVLLFIPARPTRRKRRPERGLAWLGVIPHPTQAPTSRQVYPPLHPSLKMIWTPLPRIRQPRKCLDLPLLDRFKPHPYRMLVFPVQAYHLLPPQRASITPSLKFEMAGDVMKTPTFQAWTYLADPLLLGAILLERHLQILKAPTPNFLRPLLWTFHDYSTRMT